MDRVPVAKHPGIVKRSWRDESGQRQERFDATYRGPDHRKHSRTFRRLGDADRWLRDQRAAADRGGWIDPNRARETLGDFYARWRHRREELGSPTKRTLIAYDETWRNLIAPKLGTRSIGSIGRSDVEAVVKAAEKRSPWRAHDALKVVRRLMAAAVDDELIPRNPAARVPAPRIEQDEPWILTPHEVDRLAEAVPDRYRAMVLLAAYGSLRWSELVALRLERLDLLRRRVRVEAKIVETSGGLIEGEPKTKRSRRWVSIPESVALALAQHIELFPPGVDGLVFTAPEGGPIRRAHFGTVWRMSRTFAGLDGFPFRNLRHTGATMALEAGMSPVLVAFRLGHTSTTMIEKHYGRLLEGMDREIADKLEERRNAGTA